MTKQPPIETAMLRARKARNLTQEQLAELLGIDQAFVSRIERGLAAPSLPVAKRIVDELGIEFDDLCLSGDAAPEGDPSGHTANDFGGR
jgi:XRE family transcriptional regulator, regulator of sulfur utilization